MSILFLREVGLLAVARVQLGSSEQVSQQDIFGVVSADRFFWGKEGRKGRLLEDQTEMRMGQVVCTVDTQIVVK